MQEPSFNPAAASPNVRPAGERPETGETMTSERPIWSGLTPEEHEFQYNPQRAFPDFAAARARREPVNAAARERLARIDDVAYGDHPLRRLDIYPAAEAGAPVHIFLHGGYWRAQDKANYAFVAGTLVPHGVTTVIANYELCPASTLDGVVASAIAGFDWVCRNIAGHGGDPARITLSGHSAGAHLGAAIVAHAWPQPAAVGLVGALLTSGIYDPAPAIGTSVNAELKLDAAIAARHDVERRAPVLNPAIALQVGGREPWQWVDQTFRYYSHLRRHGREPSLAVLPGHDHFDILDEYLDAGSATVRTILDHCAISREFRR